MKGDKPGPKSGPDKKKGLRMSDLAKASGLPKSTILHYVNEGLLPKPVKTSPNMAYYAPICVDRLRMIRHLQKKHRLSLAQIKAALEEAEVSGDMAAMVQLGEVIFGTGSGEHLSREGLCRETGLSAGEVAELEDLGMLLPLETGLYDLDDLNAARSYSRSAELGLKAKDGVFYTRLAKEIVDYEMKLRRRLTRDLAPAQDAMVTMEMTKTARTTRNYIIERTFQKRVLAFKTLKEEEGDRD